MLRSVQLSIIGRKQNSNIHILFFKPYRIKTGTTVRRPLELPYDGMGRFSKASN